MWFKLEHDFLALAQRKRKHDENAYLGQYMDHEVDLQPKKHKTDGIYCWPYHACYHSLIEN